MARDREIRLDRRDALLRELATTWYLHLPSSARPAVISRALDYELTLQTAPSNAKRTLLRQVIEVNDGAGLSRFQLRHIL